MLCFHNLNKILIKQAAAMILYLGSRGQNYLRSGDCNYSATSSLCELMRVNRFEL